MIFNTMGEMGHFSLLVTWVTGPKHRKVNDLFYIDKIVTIDSE